MVLRNRTSGEGSVTVGGATLTEASATRSPLRHTPADQADKRVLQRWLTLGDRLHRTARLLDQGQDPGQHVVIGEQDAEAVAAVLFVNAGRRHTLNTAHRV